MNQQYGLGIEMEGFIINESDRAQAKICSLPSSEYLISEAKKQLPEVADYVSPELCSVIIEIKSDVHQTLDQAMAEVFQIRAKLNQILAEHSCRISFQPTIPEYEFLPSVSQPNQRTQQLIERWTESGLIDHSSVCSVQINDSRPFAGLNSDAQKMELAREIHNKFSENHQALFALNPSQVRMQKIIELLETTKGKQLTDAGFTRANAAIPPYFADLESMKKWMMAHSNVSNFEETECKNEHVTTLKIKRKPFWAVEVRFADATENQEQIKKIHQTTNQLIYDQNTTI